MPPPRGGQTEGRAIPNLVLAFGEALVGVVLLDAAIKGDSIANVLRGQATQHPLGGSSSSSGNTYAPNQPNTSGSGYVNPVPGATLSRTDQGVDYTLNQSNGFVAPGNSKIIQAIPGAFGGGYLIIAQFLDGPYAGAQYYVGEGVTPAAGIKAGSLVSAGQKIADVATNPSNGILGNIEAGWWSPQHNQTLAQATGGYTEGSVTAAGAAWDAFIQALGGVAHAADTVNLGSLAGLGVGEY